MSLIYRVAVAAVSIALSAGAASSAVYKLADHPFGSSAATKDYGLRADGLDTFFTFSLGGADVSMTVSGGTATISGTIFESINKGAPEADPWDYYYTMSYTGTESEFLSWDGMGYLTNNVDTYYQIMGQPKQGGQQETFQFGPTDPKGKLSGDLYGFGWFKWAECEYLNGKLGACEDDYTYVSSQDALFVATPAPIPLPAAGWLILGGMGALGALKTRKKKA